MKEMYEWKVPESWIRAAVNMYLGTITTPAGEHICTGVKYSNQNYDNQFTLAIERETKDLPKIVSA